MKRLLYILFAFVGFTGYGQQLAFTTTSSANAWSPQLVTNSGAVLTWTATGSSLVGSPVVINTNDPTFDFSSNDGSPINITVTNTDNFAGLTQLDLYNTIDGGLVTDMDISDATALTFLNARYNQLSSLNISNNTALSRLIVRGNRQIPNQALNTSANPQLNEIWLDGTGVNAVDFSNNPLLLFVKLNNARLTSAVLNQVLIDLDSHGLSGGNLQIAGQATGQSITVAVSAAYASLTSRGWIIDVPPPVADNEDPVVGFLNIPTNLTNISVNLSWTSGTDNVGVTNYNIYKNGAFEAQVGNIRSYQVTGLAPNTLYSFYITALDGAGNESSSSNTVQATTLNTPVGNTISFTTNSSANAWSPQRVTNAGALLTWSASGSALAGSPIVINANDPSFDFSSNNGSPITITVTSADNFFGLRELDLYNSIDGGEVTDMDISNATALTLLNMRFNELNSINVNNNSALTRLIIRGNRQIPDQALNTSANPQLNYIQLDGTGINAVDFSNNPLLLDVRINNARLSSAVLDQVLIDLDAHGLSGGFLQIALNPGALTSSSLVAYNNLTNKGWFIDVPAPAAAIGPKMSITGNNIIIPHGTTTTSITDGTDFGQVVVGSSVTRTFEIQNIGNASLAIFTPVGAPGGGFTIAVQPASPVASGTATTIQVTFNATVPTGSKFANLQIISNDPTNPFLFPGTGIYSFAISAEVVAVLVDPAIVVSGNNISIVNGDQTPSVVDDTDFGDTFLSTSKVKTYTIANTGTGVLSISDIQITNFQANEYVVETLIYPLVIAAGSSFDFDVTFSPLALGTFSAQVEIFHSDIDTSTPFKFRITGKGIDPPAALMITQYYKAFGGSDNWVEIKNISGAPIAASAYYLVLFNQSLARQGLIGINNPTSSVAIPALSVGETILFKDSGALFPSASNIGSATQIILPVSFDFDGDDVILISPSNTSTSYNSRIDLIGNVSPNPSTAPEVWGNNSSFIKGGCSTEVAHKDFNENDWTELVIADVNSALSNTNLALGTQTTGPTETSDGLNWSNLVPDQTRTAIVNSSLTGAPETFFACNLIINPGVNVDYNSGGNSSNSIVLYGDLTVNGSLTIGDTESLVTLKTVANLGPITKIEKSQSLNSIYEATYWSSPVSGQQISTVFAGVDPNRVFDFKAGQINPVYAGTNYKYWHLATGTMERGRGYSADGSTTGIQTITFAGIPYNGNFSKSLFYSGSPDIGVTANENFNLVGNPYPAAIDISKFLIENALVNQIALWAKEKEPNPDGTFDPAGYIYYNQSGPSSPGVTSNIGSGQGFMVRALNFGGVDFNNGLKLIGQNTQFYKPAMAKNGQKFLEGDLNRIWLRLKSGNTKSDILIGFFEEATDGLDDRYDAVGSLDEKNISLYSQLGDSRLVIQGLGKFSPEKSVLLGITTKEVGEHNINITGMEGIFKDVDVYLVDHALNKTHNLKEGDYKFNQATIGDFSNRFTLQFSKNALDVEKILQGSEFNVFNSGEGFRINASKVVKEVRVYDMLGRTIINSKPDQQSFNLNAGNLKTGAVLIFEVKLENGNVLNKKAIKM